MLIKQNPNDFQVEELTTLKPVASGDYLLYRLEKRGWTTHDALKIVRQRWKIEPRRIAFGGLKDRHAHTIQYFTIWRGPERSLRQQEIEVSCLGRVTEPYSSRDISGNRFALVVRDGSPEEIEHAESSIAAVAQFGVPNYFDDQRFGSVAAGARFFAKALVQGEYEEALKRALLAPYAYDRAPQKREKSRLRDGWGRWDMLQQRLERGQALAIVQYLAQRPDDFAGAVQRLDPDLRHLYLSAYQSHLWNRMLARWLRQTLPAEQLQNLRLRLGEVPIHSYLDETQVAIFAAAQLPLPSGRVRLAEADPRLILIDEILAEEGVTREQMNLKDLRSLFFSKGERSVWCRPASLVGASGRDETRPGRRRLNLDFELPPGAYATLVVKRLLRQDLDAEDARTPS